MTQQQAEQVLAAGFEAYEVAMLSYADRQPGEETPSQLLRRTIREQCAGLGVAERDLYVLIPDAAYLKPEVITGWRGGPIRRGDPKVTPADGETHLRWLAEEAVDRYERALADGLDPDTAHRQAAGNAVIANDAIEQFAAQRASGRAVADARADAIAQSARRAEAGMVREGGQLPPKSEWVRPAAVERPLLERDAAPDEIAGEAIDYVTDLIAVGVDPDEAEKAVEVTGFPAPRDAVRTFRGLLADDIDPATARAQVLDGLRAPAEFTVADITGAAGEAPAETQVHDEHGIGRQPTVIEFDPWPDLPPETALTYYDIARSAVDDYEQRLAAGRDADQVRREVLSSYPADTELVSDALEAYGRLRSGGDLAGEARDRVAADMVARFHSEITPAQLDRVANAFAADDDAEAEKAQEYQARLKAAAADSDTVAERAAEPDPPGSAKRAQQGDFDAGDVVRDRQTGDLVTVTGTTADSRDFEPADTADGPGIPDRAPLAEQITECGQAVSEAEHAMTEADTDTEDRARAERCARWNADDEAAEHIDASSEGWEQQ